MGLKFGLHVMRDIPQQADTDPVPMAVGLLHPRAVMLVAQFACGWRTAEEGEGRAYPLHSEALSTPLALAT